MDKRKIRVILAGTGVDGHDRGLRIIARLLRDAGMEVIYLGLLQTPEEIVNAAIQEGVGIIGITQHAGAHIYIAKDIARLLKEWQANNISMVFGGSIPKRDIPTLKELGVREVFLPGTRGQEIIDCFETLASTAS